MAEIYIMKPPTCPTHGQMRENFQADRWECAGYDGEGCEYQVSNEDVPRTVLGYTDSEEIELNWNLRKSPGNHGMFKRSYLPERPDNLALPAVA
jgi:hypothetical protein